ncbi:MAG: hypothetical protein IPO62_13215 [Saprospiraceae bacterium]|nr:hypothetical protein [Saprospiraceae bacterium]MBK9632002.1 hypothetical protein [Saprospiraceae bacterium]
MENIKIELEKYFTPYLIETIVIDEQACEINMLLESDVDNAIGKFIAIGVKNSKEGNKFLFKYIPEKK